MAANAISQGKDEAFAACCLKRAVPAVPCSLALISETSLRKNGPYAFPTSSSLPSRSEHP